MQSKYEVGNETVRRIDARWNEYCRYKGYLSRASKCQVRHGDQSIKVAVGGVLEKKRGLHYDSSLHM